MIKYVNGDLIELAGEFDVISHCANCFCTMGSGIAPLIKKAFPEAYEVDCLTKSGDIKKLGTISHTENSLPIVVNLYAQFGYWGRNKGKIDLDYTALRSALRLVKERFSGKKFGFPKIGSGLAGGDWTIIERIIETELKDEDVTIVNYVK